MKPSNIKSTMIEGVRITISPGRHPSFKIPSVMNGEQIMEWKVRNKQSIDHFLKENGYNPKSKK